MLRHTIRLAWARAEVTPAPLRTGGSSRRSSAATRPAPRFRLGWPQPLVDLIADAARSVNGGAATSSRGACRERLDRAREWRGSRPRGRAAREPAPLRGGAGRRSPRARAWPRSSASRTSAAAASPVRRLVAVVARDGETKLRARGDEVGDGFPSLTPRFPQLHRFEREVLEQWGVVPEDHPWPKPVRFQKPYRVPGGRSAGARDRRHGLLPRRRPGDPRGRGGPGARRHHRARPLPLPVPRRDTCCTSRSRSATSTAASSARSMRRPATGARLPLRRDRWPATPPIGHGLAYCAALRGAGGRRVPPRGAGAARRRARARAAGQPHRRPRRPGRRRRLPADRLLLRPAPRRLPQPDGAPLRQPLRPRPRRPGRPAASTWTRERASELLRAPRRGRSAT